MFPGQMAHFCFAGGSASLGWRDMACLEGHARKHVVSVAFCNRAIAQPREQNLELLKQIS